MADGGASGGAGGRLGGRGLALTGLILGWVALALWAVPVVAVLAL